MHRQGGADPAAQIILAGNRVPFRVAVFVIPVDGFLSLAHAFLEADGLDSFGFGRVALAPFAGERLPFSLPDCIFHPEFKRIHSNPVGYLLQMPVDGPKSLGHTITSKSAGWRMVGVNDICIKTDIGVLAVFPIAHIKRHGFMTRISGHGQSMATVGSGIAQAVHFIRGDRPIFFHPGFHMKAQGVP